MSTFANNQEMNKVVMYVLYFEMIQPWKLLIFRDETFKHNLQP